MVLTKPAHNDTQSSRLGGIFDFHLAIQDTHTLKQNEATQHMPFPSRDYSRA